MKMLLLMHLEEDRSCVRRLLAEHEVPVFTEMDAEGHRPGQGPGWYGESAPYASSMVVAVVPDGTADDLVAAVENCRGLEDASHPVHFYQLGVERTAATAPRDGG